MPTRGPVSTRSRAAAGPGRAPRSGRTPTRPTVTIRPGPLFLAAAILITLVVTPYLRPWISQRSQISQTKAEIAALQSEISALEAERARWDDDAYVRAQARERLFMVKPGEYSYSLLDDEAPVAVDPRQAAVTLPKTAATTPWYSTLWGSVATAGESTTPQVATEALP